MFESVIMKMLDSHPSVLLNTSLVILSIAFLVIALRFKF